MLRTCQFFFYPCECTYSLLVYFKHALTLILWLILDSFNATLMMETLRDKRMMFVGDSLNRGQFVSMVCLVHKIIPDDAKSMTTNGSLTVFTAKVTLMTQTLQNIRVFFL